MAFNIARAIGDGWTSQQTEPGKILGQLNLHSARTRWMMISLLALLPLLGWSADGIEKVSDFQLIGITQDLFRQQGFDVPRGSLDIQDVTGWGRVLYIKMRSRRTTQMDDILMSFTVGGGIYPYATNLDYIAVISEVSFKENEQLILAAPAACCEQLFSSQVDVDYFSDNCLITE